MEPQGTPSQDPLPAIGTPPKINRHRRGSSLPLAGMNLRPKLKRTHTRPPSLPEIEELTQLVPFMEELRQLQSFPRLPTLSPTGVSEFEEASDTNFFSPFEDTNLESMLTDLAQKMSVHGKSHPAVAQKLNCIVEKMLDDLPAKKKYSCNSQTAVAQTYNEIGNKYFGRGDYHTAKEMYIKTRNRSRLLDRAGLVAIAIGNLGTCYWNLRMYDKALKHLQESLSMHTMLADPLCGDPKVASMQYSIGIVHFLKGENSAALDALSKSYKARRNMFGYQNLDVSRAIMALGSVYLSMKDYDMVVKCHKEALDVRRKLLRGADLAVIAATMNVAKVHFARGNYREAIIVYKDLLTVQEQKDARIDDQMQLHIGFTKHALGDALMMVGEQGKAFKLFSDIRTIYAEHLPQNDYRIRALNDNIQRLKARKYFREGY